MGNKIGYHLLTRFCLNTHGQGAKECNCGGEEGEEIDEEGDDDRGPAFHFSHILQGVTGPAVLALPLSCHLLSWRAIRVSPDLERQRNCYGTFKELKTSEIIKQGPFICITLVFLIQGDF